MTEFTLDTGGAVTSLYPDAPRGLLRRDLRWSDLDPFTQGYIEALFASLNVGGSHIGSLQTSHGEIHRCAFSDLSPSTLAAILKDCEAMLVTGQAVADRYAGEQFWRGRQAGNWRSAQRATGARGPVPAFPPLTVTLGDDGLIYSREAS